MFRRKIEFVLHFTPACSSQHIMPMSRYIVVPGPDLRYVNHVFDARSLGQRRLRGAYRRLPWLPWVLFRRLLQPTVGIQMMVAISR